MGILEEDVDKVKQSVDIVELVAEHVQLKRVGRRWVGLCPFHSERSPSFSVNQELGLYYCFGCGAKGDAISFIRNVENLEFVSAVEYLADKVGMTVRVDDVQDQQVRQKRHELLVVMKETTDFFHARLLNSPEASDARSYLRSRGFSSEDVTKFRIGWAGPGGKKLQDFLGVSTDLLVAAGLVSVDNTSKEFFYKRIMFPIFSPVGDPIAFGGRIMPEATGPKYKNSPTGILYDKSKVLYGLNWGKNSIVEQNMVIVCEGYTDVVGLSAMGVDCAVAPCGTALTEEHVKMLTNYTDTFVLMFDADQAGQTAAERLLTWEKKYGLNLVVVSLPDGQDPGEISRENPDMMREALNNPVPFMKFRVNRALQGIDLSTAEGKAKAADVGLNVIKEHPDDIIKDQYIMDLSSTLGLTPEQLRNRTPVVNTTMKNKMVGPNRYGSEEEKTGPLYNTKNLGVPLGSPEVEALRVLIDSPEDFAPMTHEVLFTNITCHTIYGGLRDNKWRVDNLEEIFTVELADFVQQLAVQESEVDQIEVFKRLVENSAQKKLVEMGEATRSQNLPMDDLLLVSQQVQWLKVELEKMKDHDASLDAAPNIFEWLIEQHNNNNTNQ